MKPTRSEIISAAAFVGFLVLLIVGIVAVAIPPEGAHALK